jgi:hypothetical protein
MDMSTPPISNVNTDTKNLKKYTGAAGRILSLMIGGAKQEEAAKAVGVSQQYVSELFAEEDFKLQILAASRDVSEKALKIDTDLLDIEAMLTERLKAHAGLTSDANTTLRMLKYVNEAKRRSAMNSGNFTGPGANGHGGTGTAGTSVTIVIPQFIQQQFVINPNSEIVGVGDRALSTINSQSLNKMIEPKLALPNPEPVHKEIRRESKRPPAQWDVKDL